jgi:hypothetical protein
MSQETRTIQEFWPRSSDDFTEIQCCVWKMKEAGRSFREIQEFSSDLPDPNRDGAFYGPISTSCLSFCIRRTVMGRRWTPHKRIGRSRFLNLDEEIRLAQWLNDQPEPPTIEEFLGAVGGIRCRTLMEIEPFLKRVNCAGIVTKLWEESQEKSHSWARCVAQRMDLKFEHPEALETLRSKFDTSALFSRWFRQMEPELAEVTPALTFNFNEIRLSTELRLKPVTSCDKRVFRRNAAKAPHITLGLCVSPLGDGPPPCSYCQAPEHSRNSTISKQWASSESYIQRMDGLRPGCSTNGPLVS